MLSIKVPGLELFDEKTSMIHETPGFDLDLEHSLLAVSKWESKFEKSFLSTVDKTREETLAYIECMILTPGIPPGAVKQLSQGNLDEVNAYINSKQTATTFGAMPESRGRSEIITSELIYYWMVAFNIPFECDRWNLNRLLALVRVCNIKNSKQKKMPRHEIARRNAELNAQRRAQLGTAG